MSAIWRSAGTRAFLLPISAVLGILNTRIIVENFGSEAFAQYGLLVALGSLLPFADLGVSAAIMNAVGASSDPANDDHVRRVILTSVRALLMSVWVLLSVNVVISALRLWPTLLGEGLMPDSGPTAATLCLALIAITLPVAIGQRVLVGLGKNHVAIAIGNLQTPIVLVSLLVIVALGASSGGLLPVIPYSVAFLLSAGTTVLAARLLRPNMRTAILQVPRVRREKGERVADVAWPMLVQMIAVPLAMQTDRIVLSHVDPSELAQYNLAAQMYLPIWQVTSAAGVALWPIFAKDRARGERGRESPARLALLFGVAATVLCLGITVVRPWLAAFASDGEIAVPLGLAVAFSLLMIVQAVKYPFGIFLTDARGLRFQALMVILMMPFNVVVSIALARRFGAVGPVLGSFAGVLLFEAIPNGWYVRRLLGGHRRDSGAHP